MALKRIFILLLINGRENADIRFQRKEAQICSNFLYDYGCFVLILMLERYLL
jgi:hypothetical protein